VPYKHETVAKLLDQRLNFLAMNPRSLPDIYADIRLLGGIAGKSKQASQLVTRMQREFRRISQNARRLRTAANSRRPCRVYCEAWPNPRISSPPWVAELIGIAGGQPVLKPGAKVTDEEVAAANPDVIVLAWAAVGNRSKPHRAYSVDAWKDIAAIRNRQVHVIRDEWLNTPGPPLLRGAKELARMIAHVGQER
jgi:iron complex transport system substrate-binding protein